MTKKLMESLKADPTGEQCAATVQRYRATERTFRKGTADARMLDVVEHTCCRAAGAKGAASARPPWADAGRGKLGRRRRQRQRQQEAAER